VIHFHDLRHTGNQFAADTGATLRELMDRMGTQRHGPPWSISTAAMSGSVRSRTALSQLAEGS